MSGSGVGLLFHIRTDLYRRDVTVTWPCRSATKTETEIIHGGLHGLLHLRENQREPQFAGTLLVTD